MDAATINANLKSIHEGNQIDGRTLRSLKRNGYISSDGMLTSWGFRTLGVYRNIPKLPTTDPAFYRGRNAAVVETIYTSCNCCGEHSSEFGESYVVSVEKLAERYNDYANQVNKYLADNCWDHNLDDMVDRGLAPKGTSQMMLRLAQEKIWFSDFHYTWHILKDLMLAIIKGESKAYTSTSYKYSITDTIDEIRELVADGPAQYTINVEVSR